MGKRKDITLDEFIKLLQKLSDEGKGDYVMISEWGPDDPYVSDDTRVVGV